jgi:hypothetical protein
MVSVLSIGPKVGGFKPGGGDGFLRAIKTRRTTSFWEVKPSAPRREILRRVKSQFGTMNKKKLRKVKFIVSFPRSSCLLLDDSAGRIARELRWTNQEFSSVNIIPP